jgi:hypothetical protein
MGSSSALTPKDEKRIVRVLNRAVTKSNAVVTARRIGKHVDVVLVRGGTATGCIAAVNIKSAEGS